MDNTIREMAEACIARGYSYLGITDHSKVAAYANGLNVDALKRQAEEIDKLNEEFAGRLHIFKGIEWNICAMVPWTLMMKRWRAWILWWLRSQQLQS